MEIILALMLLLTDSCHCGSTQGAPGHGGGVGAVTSVATHVCYAVPLCRGSAPGFFVLTLAAAATAEDHVGMEHR